MKRKLLIFVMLLAFVLLLSITVSATNLYPSVELADGTESSPKNGVIYLPSYINPTSVQIKFKVNSKKITLDGEPVASGDTVDITPYAKIDTDTRVVYYEVPFVLEGASSPDCTVVFYRANTLPVLHISTSIGKSTLLGETTDSSAVVTLVDSSGSILLLESSTEVRVRGNTTNSLYKKPFQVKFDSKQNVLGMGKARTWILLANYLDQSYLRNSVLYKLAKSIGMDAPDFKNVEVYVDGEYQGLYLLCEKVNINEYRVNIHELEDDNNDLNPEYGSTTVVTDGALIDETVITEYKYVNDVVNPDDITGGYLIELDNNNKSSRSQFGSYFITQTVYGENLYVIRSPEYCSKEEVEYIARLFAEMEEAMASSNGKNSLGKHYSEYIDMDSFAYAYIIAEFGRNYDAGSASIYFYKDRDINGETSKIVKGPLWDCDNTLGNIHRNNAQDQLSMWAANRTPWNMLTRHNDFNALVKTHFETAYDLIYDMLDKGGFIDAQLAEIGYSAELDRMRWKTADESSWPLYGDGSLHWFQLNGNAFPAYSLYSDGVNNSKSTAVGYLCVTLQQRTEYLAKMWFCDVTARTRTLNDPPPPLELPSDDIDPPVTDEAILSRYEWIIKLIIEFFKKLLFKKYN